MKSVADQIFDQHPQFAEEVKSLPVADLKARIVSMAQQLEESENFKKEDEELIAAKAAARELAAPYNEVKRAVNLKTRFLIELLKERG